MSEPGEPQFFEKEGESKNEAKEESNETVEHPNFNEEHGQGAQERSPRERARNFEGETQEFLRRIFHFEGAIQDTARVAVTRVKPVLDRIPEGDEVGEKLRELIELRGEDEELFVQRGLNVFAPILSFAREHPEEFEAVERQQVVEQPGYIPLNEFMACEVKDDGTVYIHLAPGYTLGLKMRSMIIDAMKNLAHIVNENPNIKRIVGISWIVGEHPGLLRRLGFTVEEEVSEEDYERYFPEETRRVGRASMSREEFLEKYLGKEGNE